MPTPPKNPRKRTNADILKAAFPMAYIRNGLNGSAAIQEIKPHIKPDSAKVVASTILTDENVKRDIKSLLLGDNEIITQINTAIEQEPSKPIDWHGKHKYIETALKLKGYLKDDAGQSVNIGLVIRK